MPRKFLLQLPLIQLQILFLIHLNRSFLISFQEIQTLDFQTLDFQKLAWLKQCCVRNPGWHPQNTHASQSTNDFKKSRLQNSDFASNLISIFLEMFGKKLGSWIWDSGPSSKINVLIKILLKNQFFWLDPGSGILGRAQKSIF